MTLSPKITVSNSPFSINRFRIVRQGLLRAFASRAQTPIRPITLDLRSRSLSWASKEVRTEVTDERLVPGPERLGELDSALPTGGLTGWGPSGRHIAERDRCCGDGVWTCTPIPSWVDVRAVEGFETTFTGDVATVAVAA